MITLSSNVNGIVPNTGLNDIYLDAQGNISFSYDIDAVLEACSQAVQTLLGELVLNTNQGMPYFETVWIGVPNIQQFNGALRTAITNVPNVLEIVSLITSQTNNTLYYTAIIRTTFGITNLVQQIGPDGIIT